MTRFRSNAAAYGIAALLALASSCATPTSLRLEAFSEVPCDRNAAAVLVTAGSLSELPSGAPSAASTRCEADGRLGSVVIAPGGSKDATIAFAMMTRPDGQSADTCLDPARASGCIVAKRRLRFEANHEISMRIDLRLSCLGISCNEGETCVRGACVSADVECGSSCDETALPGVDPSRPPPAVASDGGVPESDPTDGAVPDSLDASRFDAGALFDAGTLPADGGYTVGPRGIAVGTNHACVLYATGQVGCWGANDDGQLGDGTTVARAQPVAAGVPPATAIVAGNRFSCALLTTGAVMCWGINARGQLGNGSDTLSSSIPRNVQGITSATSLAAGDSHACVWQDEDGVSGANVLCWGANESGQLGRAPPIDSNVPLAVTGVPGGTKQGIVGAGARHSCATLGTSFSCWGDNSSGQLGDGTLTSRSTPATGVLEWDVIGLSLGATSSCFILGAGSRLRCCGSNTYGELGDNSKTPHSVPLSTTNLVTASVDDAGTTVFTPHAAVEVALGDSHACAVDSTGSLMCWGRNESGQLGAGVSGDQLRLTLVPALTRVTTVAARAARTCALAANRIVCTNPSP